MNNTFNTVQANSNRFIMSIFIYYYNRHNNRKYIKYVGKLFAPMKEFPIFDNLVTTWTLHDN